MGWRRRGCSICWVLDSNISTFGVNFYPPIHLPIGGDSHTMLGSDVFGDFGMNPLGPYATIVNGVCIVQAWSVSAIFVFVLLCSPHRVLTQDLYFVYREYNRLLGTLRVQFDVDGNVVDCNGMPLIPLNSDKYEVRDHEEDFELGPEDAAIVTDYLVGFPMVVQVNDSQAIVEVLQTYRDQVDDMAHESIAIARDNICHTRGGTINELCPSKDIESMLGGWCVFVSGKFVLVQCSRCGLCYSKWWWMPHRHFEGQLHLRKCVRNSTLLQHHCQTRNDGRSNSSSFGRCLQ